MQFCANGFLPRPPVLDQTQDFMYAKQAFCVSSYTPRPPIIFLLFWDTILLSTPAWPPICNPLALGLQVTGITHVHHHAWLALILLQFIYISIKDTRLAFNGCIHFIFKNALYIICFSNLAQLQPFSFWIEDTRVSVSVLSWSNWWSDYE